MTAGEEQAPSWRTDLICLRQLSSGLNGCAAKIERSRKLVAESQDLLKKLDWLVPASGADGSQPGA